ncbi:MAG: ABC transporter permease [Gammaproteobacteria bacterium]
MALLRSVSVLGVLALGMAVVIIGRGIDLSQVAIALVSAGIAAILIIGGLATPAAIGVGFVVALGLGLLNGAIVAYLKVPPLFATLASAFFFVGTARVWLFDSAIISLPADGSSILTLGQQWLGVPIPLIVFIVCALAVHLFLSYTVPGLFIYAHGDNPEAARLSGIPVHRMTLLEYAISATIGYVGGLVMLASTGMIDLNIANSALVFEVILVAILGGVSLAGARGGVGSVLAGTLLIGVLVNGMIQMNLGFQLQGIVTGGVLLMAIMLDSWLHPRDEETARQGD